MQPLAFNFDYWCSLRDSRCRGPKVAGSLVHQRILEYPFFLLDCVGASILKGEVPIESRLHVPDAGGHLSVMSLVVATLEKPM